MYKPVIRNILTTTWKNGLLGNSYKNNNALLFLILNGVQVNSLTSQLMQARSYRRIFRKDTNSELNTLLENLKDIKTVEAADEITKIITQKDNETAKKKIEELCKDPEVDKRYKTLELEIDWWRQEARQVPDNIEPFSMLQLLQLKGNSKRKYLRYLYLTEKKKQSEEKKKEKKTEKRLEWVEEKKERGRSVLDIENLEYSLEKNAMFLRVYVTTMNKLYNNNVMKSMMFGNKLILDCSYDTWMGPQEVLSCAKQITEGVSKNRYHDRPFDMYLCNAHKESKLMLQLKKCIPTLFDDDYPINVTEKSYLDLFDKDKLCYLTPHCRQDLTHYDPDTTYIIGAFVDKGIGQPMSLAKAKQEGLRMAKLPLDLYLDWGVSSSKSMTVDCVIKIMLDLQIEANWEKAVRHVPSRKTKATRDYVEKHGLRPQNKKKMSLNLCNVIDEEIPKEDKREVDKKPQRERISMKSAMGSEDRRKDENRIQIQRLEKNAYLDGYGAEQESHSNEKKEDWQWQLQRKILKENMLKRIEAKEQIYRDNAEEMVKEKENTKKFSYNERMKKRQHWND